jgi:phosphoenolpyruvate carboxykinase (ATP)
MYVIDGFAGWDPACRMAIRFITSRTYHALFMNNLLIKDSTPAMDSSFAIHGPDFTIIDCGEFPTNPRMEGATIDKDASCVVNFRDRKMAILGTQHIGESFDGIFSIMNYYMPKRHILPMNAACVETFDGDVTIMFGSKRSGRTMLGMAGDWFIGDAGHCWTD